MMFMTRFITDISLLKRCCGLEIHARRQVDDKYRHDPLCLSFFKNVGKWLK
jgi:hypothetical protein